MINYILVCYLFWYLIMAVTGSSNKSMMKLGLLAPILLPILVIALIVFIVKMLSKDYGELNEMLYKHKIDKKIDHDKKDTNK